MCKAVTALPFSRWWVIIAMMILILITGCIFEPASIIIVSTPIFVPAIKALGFDPVWYGILLMMNAEVASLIPPGGLNWFIIRNSVDPKQVSSSDVMAGIYIFAAFHALNMILIMIFPQIALWLPTVMKGAAG